MWKNMTPSEKLLMADLPVAILLLGMDVCFLALRKKMSAARTERVAKGEKSTVEAMRADRLALRCGWGVTGCGLFLIGMWETSH